MAVVLKHHLILIFLIVSSLSLATSAHAAVNTSAFFSCLLSSRISNYSLSPSPPFISHSAHYFQLLNSSIKNLRFSEPSIHKPLAIVLPSTKCQLRSSVLCCRESDVLIRVRSGGHSYEGLSYTAEHGKPFAVIDLTNLNRVRVDRASETAWVESGATLGEIYDSVASRSGGSLGFSAGSCPTIGSGGHISGGGFGLLSRKYGLAADNVVDAVLIDSSGRVMDRVAMGEDAFWAIRGGGGGSWGVVYAWKLRLVPLPARVTVISGRSALGQSRSIAELVHKWQYVAPSLPDDFYLTSFVAAGDHGTVAASFSGQFLGPKSSAISILTQRFPELNVSDSDCVEVSWIESVVHFAGLSSASDLRNRNSSTGYFKAKSDYVRAYIPLTGLIGALDLLSKQPQAYIILDPYGGAMGTIGSGEIPFPHRGGNLYGIQYMVDWTAEMKDRSEEYVAWLRGFYDYMGPFVSRNPRAAYVNYVDLDLGTNNFTGNGSGPGDVVGAARVWGEKYFLGNFDRLVKVKTAIDPDNVFSNEQSIPPFLPK